METEQNTNYTKDHEFVVKSTAGKCDVVVVVVVVAGWYYNYDDELDYQCY